MDKLAQLEQRVAQLEKQNHDLGSRPLSYRVLPSQVPVRKGASRFLHPRSEVSSNWHRVCELWYENVNGWIDSVLTNPPEYTKPSWGTRDTYPFFEPGVDLVSMFILERPTDDWLRQITPLYV